MKDPVSDLARQARELALEDRERLVDELLDSLSESGVAALDPAWEAELARRVADIRAGRVELVDADIVFARARRRTG
ncbi:MAG TPA: addiction module protein [Burkholderiaceae bacterium]